MGGLCLIWAGSAALPQAALAAGQAIHAAVPEAADQTGRAAAFQADRKAILAMAGDFAVTFDFTETVALAPGYQVKPKKQSRGHEVVRVLEDRGDFISLQHILVVNGPDGPMPVKHWRQDWQYEPARVLVYVGGNSWAWRDVPPAQRKGAWSQTVYQVDDAPRYGAMARWSHARGHAEWTPPAEWRPLPRRDATTRADYHVIDAVNRHAITPHGWVHEQDNTKLALDAASPQALVREIGVNNYLRDPGFAVAAATDYWAATEAYWAGVRAAWAELAEAHSRFGLTVQGEPEPVYIPILALADEVAGGKTSVSEAVQSARQIIGEMTTTRIGRLEERIAQLPETR